VTAERDEAETRSSAAMPGVARPSFTQAASWSFVMQGGRQGLKVGLTFVLAALLGPEAYGVAAMALVFVLFIDVLQQQGMAAALIQRRSLTRTHLDTAFWLLGASGVVLVLVTVASAGWWAAVNDTPSLRAVIIGLTPIIPLKNLSIVQSALLRREMAFKRLAQRDLTAIAAGGVVALAAAFGGWGVWALVVQQVTVEAVAVVVLWRVSDWRPGRSVSRSVARELVAFSSGLLVSSLGNFLNNQSDTLLIGLFFGPRVVGIYRLGLRLVETLVSVLTGSVQSVGLPDLSPVVDDPPELRRRVDRLAKLAAVTTVPVLGILAGVAEPLMGVLGSEWQAAAIVAQALCVAGIVRAWVVIDGPLLVASGSTFVQAATSWLAGIFSAVAFTIAGFWLQGLPVGRQAFGIAVARTLVWGVGIAAMHVWIMHRYAKQSPVEMVAPVVGPLIAGLGAAAAGIAAARYIDTGPALVGLVVAGVASTAAAAGIMWVTDPWIRRRARTVFAATRHRVRPGSGPPPTEPSPAEQRNRV